MFAVLSRLITLGLLLTVLSCTANRLGVVRSIEAEKELGKETTPEFLLAKGGLYNSAETQRYVQSLVTKLSANTFVPEEFDPIPIRVLDTSTPSAYALPGGSIYVSRGIIALANDEAQLAGVIAHEIGHVIARHSAKSVAANERFILDVIQNERARLRQAPTEAQRVAIIEEQLKSRKSEVTSFSKEQELEADRLAIQILSASGYGAVGFGNLLRRLDAWQSRRAQNMGVTPDELEDLAEESGYPEIGERVAALGQLTDVPAAPGTRDRLMAVIDGLRFEDRYNGGFIRNAKYWHKRHGISFNVPSKFFALHGEHLRLVSSIGGILLRVDPTEPGRFEDLATRAQQEGSPFTDVRVTVINGIPAVIGQTVTQQEEDKLVGQVVFLNLGTQVASMTMLSKISDQPAAQPLFDEMTNSFRRIRAGEVPAFRRYEARRVAPGESLSGLARTTTFDGDREAATRLLNGLNIGESIATGDWIKLVK